MKPIDWKQVDKLVRNIVVKNKISSVLMNKYGIEYEDQIQIVLLTLVESKIENRKINNIKSYIYVSTKNILRDLIKHSKRYKRIVNSNTVSIDEIEDEFQNNLYDIQEEDSQSAFLSKFQREELLDYFKQILSK